MFYLPAELISPHRGVITFKFFSPLSRDVIPNLSRS